jgi:hypothetical protein
MLGVPFRSLNLSLPAVGKTGTDVSGPRNEQLDPWVPSQGVCIPVVLNLAVARDPGMRYEFPNGQGTYCLPTFRHQLLSYPWCFEDSQTCLALLHSSFLYSSSHRIIRQIFPPQTPWNVHLVRRPASSSVSPHTPAPDPSAFLDLSSYHTSSPGLKGYEPD